MTDLPNHWPFRSAPYVELFPLVLGRARIHETDGTTVGEFW